MWTHVGTRRHTHVTCPSAPALPQERTEPLTVESVERLGRSVAVVAPAAVGGGVVAVVAGVTDVRVQSSFTGVRVRRRLRLPVRPQGTPEPHVPSNHLRVGVNDPGRKRWTE